VLFIGTQFSILYTLGVPRAVIKSLVLGEEVKTAWSSAKTSAVRRERVPS
jgi:hypothetical protein